MVVGYWRSAASAGGLAKDAPARTTNTGAAVGGGGRVGWCSRSQLGIAGLGRHGRSFLEASAMIQITPQMRIWLAVEPVDFRNYSERVIIPSAFRGSMESMADVAGFVLYDSE